MNGNRFASWSSAMRRHATGLFIALPLVAGAASAADTALPPAIDLAADAKQAAAARVPLLVFYSLPGCPHCEAVRRSHLAPLARATPLRAIVRQVDLQSMEKLADFAGRTLTHDAFAKAEKVRFAPAVAFYDARGERLGEPLMGAMIPDFYGIYLEEALTQATAAMKRAPPPGR